MQTQLNSRLRCKKVKGTKDNEVRRQEVSRRQAVW